MTCCICGKGSGKFELTGWNINGKICKNCYPMLVRLNDFYTKKIKTNDPYIIGDTKQALSYLESIDVIDENKDAIANMITKNEERLAKLGHIRLEENRKMATPSMLTTTGYNFEGYKITKYIGVISAETVLGTSALSDFTSSVADFFGGKSISYTTALTKAKTDALQKLIKRANSVGANALIGIAYNISVIGNNMLIASCDATAVVAELESKGEKIIEYPNKH